ncbi:proton-coupled zinc antiporter SLC30A2-like [Xenentodon cancila]
MDPAAGAEERRLIQTYLEPLAWTGSPEENCSDPDFSDEASSVDGLLQPEIHNISGTEGDVKAVAMKKLLAACAVSLLFVVGEVIGGYAAHSLAIMTDAAHLLTDFGSIVISIFSLTISSRPRSQTMTFGWHRAEILGMLLNVVSVWAVTAVLVSSAVQRIADGDYDVDGGIMLVTSGCAVGVNILMVLILHQSGASHGHEIPTSRLRKEKPRRCGHGNASVTAAFIHVLGDLLQSVGVLLAAVVIHFWPEYKVADPICTFLFSTVVIGTTLPATKDVFRILMEGCPQDLGVGVVTETLLSVGGVTAVKDLHVWSLNMNYSLLSAHIAIDEGSDPQVFIGTVTRLLRSEFGFSSVTLQVERCRTGRSWEQVSTS